MNEYLEDMIRDSQRKGEKTTKFFNEKQPPAPLGAKAADVVRLPRTVSNNFLVNKSGVTEEGFRYDYYYNTPHGRFYWQREGVSYIEFRP